MMMMMMMMKKNFEMEKEICVIFATHGCLNSSILFKIFKTNQNQKKKGYAFKDLILDCVEKMSATKQRRQERQHRHCHANDYC
jgi:hypothetical protein